MGKVDWNSGRKLVSLWLKNINQKVVLKEEKRRKITKYFLQIFLLASLFAFTGNYVSSRENISGKKAHLNLFYGNYLDFCGRVLYTKDWTNAHELRMDSATVTLLNESNQVIETSYSNRGGLFRLKLPLNEVFLIKVEKKGWVAKTIEVDTRVADNKVRYYYFPFDVFVFQDVPSIDVSLLNRPVAKVMFNSNLNKFHYNYRYTKHVNETIRNLYVTYYKSSNDDSARPDKNRDVNKIEKKY